MRTSTQRYALDITATDAPVTWLDPTSNATQHATVEKMINGSSYFLGLDSNFTPSPSGGGYSKTVTGTAYNDEPFFHVRWGWITLPALLTLVSPAFLIATIWASHRSGTPVLGSGLRALVGCHVDEDIRGHVGDVDYIDGVENMAKETRVEMRREKNEMEWRLVGVEK